jgi:hypothetical protein
VRSIIQRSSGNTVIIAQVIQIEAEDLLTVHPLRSCSSTVTMETKTRADGAPARRGGLTHGDIDLNCRDFHICQGLFNGHPDIVQYLLPRASLGGARR